MASIEQPLSGTEYVLVAQVPKAGPRWHQVHFNKEVTAKFFRAESNRRVTVARVDSQGLLHEPVSRPLVLSPINKNCKIEFDFGGIRDYPSEGPPLLLVLELDLRTFRYQALLPGAPGHDEMLQLNHDLPSVGRGHLRVVTTLDEIELRWPECRLRNPRKLG